MKLTRLIWITIGISLLTVPMAHAQKASEQKMADEALKPFVPRGQLERVAHVQRMREEMNSRANSEPNHVGSASVIFSSGKSVEEIGEIANRYQLEVSRIEMKVPRGDQGIVLSMAIGADDFVKREGDFQARANRAIGVLRYDLVQMAKLMSGDEQVQWMEAMHTPFLIYSIEVIGKSNNLRMFLERQDVAAIVPHEDDSIVNLHNILKDRYSQARARRTAGADR